MAECCVSGRARIGANVVVGPGVTIDDGAVIGRNVTLVADIVVKCNAVIGDNVIVGYCDSDQSESLAPEERLVVIGESAKVRSGAVLYWGVSLGDRSQLGHNTVIRERTGIGADAYIGPLSVVEHDTKIGDFVGVQTKCYLTAHCDIGPYTFLAPGVITSNDNAMLHRRAGHGRHLAGPQTQRYVRVGAGAVLLPGVILGEGCVVGGGSVVTHDVLPYKVALGVPARVVRDAPRDDNLLEGGVLL